MTKSSGAALKSWEHLIKPHKINFERMAQQTHHDIMVVEPLERGFGVTLGNAMRRVLLSSIQGSAVTAVNVDGVFLEFASLAGVVEDMTDIIINLKSLNVRLISSESSKVFHLKAQGPCVVTAGMIECGGDLEVVNPDQVICTLTQDGAISMELTISRGKGYVPAPQYSFQNKPIGQILLDARFSPIDNVSIEVKDARVGQSTDFDSLTLTVQTNGTISPRDAINEAAMILHDQLRSFVNADMVFPVAPPCVVDQDTAPPAMNNILNTLIRNIEDLTPRCRNDLNKMHIIYVGDLVKKTEKELLQDVNTKLGKRSIETIKKYLSQNNLSLEMSIPDWPPQDMEYPQ